MDKIQEDLLIRRYPEIFKDAGGDPAQTCMAWGIAVGNGWFDLIDTLCAQLVAPLRREQSRLNRLHAQLGKSVAGQIVDEAAIAHQQQQVAAALAQVPVAAQVKEKFGGLRFYLDGATSEQNAKVSLAEDLSYRICETCGSPGRPYSISWVRTLCPGHADAVYGPAAAEFRAKNPLDTIP